MVRKVSAKTSSPMVTTIPITKARDKSGALIQPVHLNKEYLILEKDKSPLPASWTSTNLRLPQLQGFQGPRAYSQESARIPSWEESRPAEEFLAELRAEGEGNVPGRRQKKS